ncbi:LysR family transcriptional regulator [Thiohalobacter sp. IOR34]|uniref:LysR family transcriptional regulator n=1 Tax=Thiohalobacter sp. IOR34 TaxID=3057176 RepID=UPI0025B0EA2E|nr:LysR family transcriptional regulator [Thiohalobacter sp. IOR34]WJW74520.1 LysR family transcriptional regulator [Thiohalobacter sp. IOR34]
MDLNSLRAFVAVAEEGSFSTAASQLHLTQPAVSKRVASLETSLGCALFDRIGRRVGLTEAGQALLPRARRILAEMEDSRRALSNLSGRVGGVLRVGTSHHIGLHRLPPVLRRYTGHFPEVELDLRFMDSEAACRAVERGELELAIVTLPPSAGPSLERIAVWPDPLSVVTAPDHPLARRRRIRPAQLAEYPAILPAESTYTRQIAEQALRPLGLDLRLGLATNYLETIKMLVSVGLGWSLLPRTMLDGQIRAIPVTGLSLQRTLGVVRHRQRTLSNAAQRLLDLLREEA